LGRNNFRFKDEFMYAIKEFAIVKNHQGEQTQSREKSF